MTDESKPSNHLFQPGREKTGGRKKGTLSRHVSIAKVEQRVYQQINAALARHERSIDKIFEKDALEALRLDGALNRTTVQLLELLQQRRGSEGAAPASNRMTPRQIDAAAARAFESNAAISDLDAMEAYARLVNRDEDDALLIELRRDQLARAAARPALAQPDDAPHAQQSEPLHERGLPIEGSSNRLIPADDVQEQPEAYPDPPPPPRVIDAPLPDGPPVDWDDPHLTLVMATPAVRR
jgi:hypothetical protein